MSRLWSSTTQKKIGIVSIKIGEIHLIPPLYDAEHYITVRDAIGHLQPIEAGEICPDDILHRSSALSAINMERIQQSVPGGTWRDWDESLRLKCHRRNRGQHFHLFMVEWNGMSRHLQ